MAAELPAGHRSVVAVDQSTARAGSLLRAGDLALAAEAAASCADPRCGLVRARALFGLGKFAEAAEAARLARPSLGDLEAFAAEIEGEAQLYAGDERGALDPLRAAVELDPHGPPAMRASALLADALLALKQFAAAREAALKAAAFPGQPSDVKAALAWDAAQATADPRARSLAMRSFWLDHPEHPSAEEARSMEGDLPPPTGHELLLRASRLLSAGLPAQATAQALVASEKLSGEERAEASLLYARSLAADGKRNEAPAALEEAWKHGSPRVAAQAGMLLARDRARRGRDAEAIAIADGLARKFPEAAEAEESVLFVSRLLADEGKRPLARARLAKLAARRSGPNASAARWTLAWMSYRDGLKDAGERFAEFAASATSDDERAQGLYWEAHLARPAQQNNLYKRAAELDPLGWYGMLAREKLGAPPPSQTPFPPSRGAAPDASAPRLAIALELIDLGLLAEAAQEADFFVREHPGDALAPALPIYESAGRYDRSMSLASSLLGSRGPRAPRVVLEGAYPVAFPAQVGAAASLAGLDPYFLLAVMRRESLFQADARSAAGAVGLLQLLPATARRAATVLGRPPLKDEELVVPATAIDLGAWYLSELVGRFGDAAVALAAYNAGPRVAAPWASQGAGRPLDEWVEDIPYRETRRYVKNVAGVWSAYRILAGGAPPALSATVPHLKAGANF